MHVSINHADQNMQGIYSMLVSADFGWKLSPQDHLFLGWKLELQICPALLCPSAGCSYLVGVICSDFGRELSSSMPPATSPTCSPVSLLANSGFDRSVIVALGLAFCSVRVRKRN
ncbi:hypothetical protein SLE2022_014810 [Rubroshorea leprosula]